MPFVLILFLMMLCVFVALAVICVTFEEGCGGFGGFLIFMGVELFLLTLVVLGGMWLITASDNETLDWETFHNIVVDVRNGEEVQCVKIRHRSSIEFINMNRKFTHVIKEGTFVRRHANKHWSCNVYTIHPGINYELIGPKHERYAEVKEKMSKAATTQPSN
jgi:hypothetical protein